MSHIVSIATKLRDPAVIDMAICAFPRHREARSS